MLMMMMMITGHDDADAHGHDDAWRALVGGLCSSRGKGQ